MKKQNIKKYRKPKMQMGGVLGALSGASNIIGDISKLASEDVTGSSVGKTVGDVAQVGLNFVPGVGPILAQLPLGDIGAAVGNLISPPEQRNTKTKADLGLKYNTNPYGMRDGGSIHIKPQNKGKFTAYKKRTGKTTEEALHSKDPHVRQMANFARNSASWSKKDGGNIYTENSEHDLDHNTIIKLINQGYKIAYL
jgi:hypothetical protein